MDVSKLSIGDVAEAVIDADVIQQVSEPVVSAVEEKKPPRPIPEITAEIIRDMDNLCDWLHKVQKLHLEITRLREQRMEAEIAARWAQMHPEQDAVLFSD